MSDRVKVYFYNIDGELHYGTGKQKAFLLRDVLNKNNVRSVIFE